MNRLKLAHPPKMQFALILLSVVFIFIFDYLTPLGSIEWLLYVFPLFIVSDLWSRKWVLVATAVLTGLIIIGLFTSPHGVPIHYAVFNRTLGSIVLWSMAFLLIQRRQVSDEIRQLNARLTERANELEATNKELESFSYSVSHDLRAPLRAIDGFSRILIEEYSEGVSPEIQRYLGIIRTNTEHMGQLIDDLLSFSRMSRQPLRLLPVRMKQLTEQALETLQSEIDGRRVEIHVGELPVCMGDPTLLRQVMINLCGNALKFTRRREMAKIEIGGLIEQGIATIYVRDNGVGFDMAYAGKLFGVFQRLHSNEQFEGTGVGLALVQRIISRHGGRVWADAEVDKGATLHFTLREGKPLPVTPERTDNAEQSG